MVELVGPEPRGVVVDGLAAQHRVGDGGALPVGVVEMLESDVARGARGIAARDVARRVDVRNRRAALSIHHDAALDRQPRGSRHGGVGRDADPDHDGIGGDRGAIRTRDDDAVRGGVQRVDGHTRPDGHAVVPVGAGDLGSHPRPDDTRQRHGGYLEHRDVDTKSACRRGNFEPDEAGADDRDAAPRNQGGLQPPGVVDRAQIVHEVGSGPGHRQSAGLPAGGEQDRVRVDRRSARQFDTARSRIHADHLGARHELDVVVGPPLRRQDLQRVRGFCAGQELLRQRWPLIRRVGLVADQHDAAVEAAAA